MQKAILNILVQKMLGSIRKTASGCWVCDAGYKVGKSGYRQVSIIREGERYREYTHRLSYRHFKGVLKKGVQVCHKCDVPACCNPDHLFSGTAADNLEDMVSKGRSSRGERRYSAKITEADVRKMYKMADQGISQYEIAAAFGLHKRYACLILNGHRWKHLYEQHRA